MRRNMGSLDRALRVAIGLVLLSLTVFGPQTLWGLIGLVPLATAAIGFCPAYLPFGFTTRSTRVRRTA
jgi:hypothetical protein